MSHLRDATMIFFSVLNVKKCAGVKIDLHCFGPLWPPILIRVKG